MHRLDLSTQLKADLRKLRSVEIIGRIRLTQSFSISRGRDLKYRDLAVSITKKGLLASLLHASLIIILPNA